MDDLNVTREARIIPARAGFTF